MSTSVIQPSFAAGELSPALFARVDLEKYRSGAAKLRNWFVDYRGGAATRPGSIFVAQCKDVPGQPRLIDFIVSTEAAYVLEFGNHYIRFIAQGAYVEDVPGVPFEIVSPYGTADLPQLKYTQSANVMTIDHPSYPVYDVRRLTPTTFSITPDIVGPSIIAPPLVYATQVNGTATPFNHGYRITSINGLGEESQGSYPLIIAGDLLNQTTGVVNSITWVPVDGAVFYRVYKVGPTPSGVGNVGSPVPTLYGYIGQTDTTSFIDNNIASDYSRAPPTFQDPFALGQLATLSVGTPGTGYTGTIVLLNFTGDGTGASGYGVIDPVSGSVVGVVLLTPGQGYTTCVVSDFGANTALYNVTIGQETGTYPSAPGYFQQRRVHGGTLNFPEAMVFSQTGQYNNFDTSPISLDTDAITVSVASRQVNAIKSFTAMPTGLIVLTTGGGFLISGGGNSSPITPSNVSALPQASSGCNDLPPLVINYDVLYGQARGNVVRDLAFNFYVQSYTGTDRSVLASHLFSNYTLKEWCYAEEPFRLVQCVRSDGRMLVFTYVPEQEIFAWTPWDTNGFYRSIASIPEGNENAVYTIVQRYQGGAWKYYIERQASRLFANLEDAVCLDCALQLPNTYPAADLQLGVASGMTNAAATAAVFVLGDVGKVIWGNGGMAVVVNFIDATHVGLDIQRAFSIVPDDPFLTPEPLMSGAWVLNEVVTEVSGLDHLDGLTVAGLFDGMPVDPVVISAGTLALPQPASIGCAGLPFLPQLKTLRLDVGDPTIQNKRKLFNFITARVYATQGLYIGQDFERMTLMKDTITTGIPPRWNTDDSVDARTLPKGSWTPEGQVCFEQRNPLPATILGVIPEVLPGDTQR